VSSRMLCSSQTRFLSLPKGRLRKGTLLELEGHSTECPSSYNIIITESALSRVSLSTTAQQSSLITIVQVPGKPY